MAVAEQEGYTQVAQAGSGDKIRNVTQTVGQADGTDADVKSQVVIIGDSPVAPSLAELLSELIMEVRGLRHELGLVIESVLEIDMEELASEEGT